MSHHQWRTPAENRIATELGRLQGERIRVLDEMDIRQRQLEEELSDATESASEGARLLLTAQGDALVDIVEKCLTSMGFGVTNMDKIYPEKDRREDLQVTASEAPDWLALVEVRGYRGGAQVNDLMRLERFRTRYLRDKGTEPTAVWYIVSQLFEDDPSTRPPILQGNEAELATLGEGGGLAIDTADLFRLWMAVEEGRLTAEEARSRLIGAQGRFTFEL
jgi:hypothetical protein